MAFEVCTIHFFLLLIKRCLIKYNSAPIGMQVGTHHHKVRDQNLNPSLSTSKYFDP
jgi:hypothetical protein